MSIFSDAAAELWPAYKAAGMLAVATDDDGDFDVDFRRPPRLLPNGAISNEFEIEYQSADRTLVEGTALALTGTPDPADEGNYRVRQPPDINAPGNAADGTFRCAMLTKV